MHHFARQDLRDRSFQGLDLTEADFQGADLRGCNFRGARLVAANFEGARIGLSRRKLILLVGLVLATIAGLGWMLLYLLFGVLGQTPGDRAWPYVIAFYIVLGLTQLLTTLSIRLADNSRHFRWFLGLAGVFILALVGFFYGGQLGGSLSPHSAKLGGIAGAITALAISSWNDLAILQVGLLTGGSLYSYTFTFLVGTQTIALLQVQRWFTAGCWAILLLLSLYCTWYCLTQTGIRIYRLATTCFEKADLTNVRGLVVKIYTLSRI